LPTHTFTLSLHDALPILSVGQLFSGLLLPGLMMATLFILYVIVLSWLKPAVAPRQIEDGEGYSLKERLVATFTALLPAAILIFRSEEHTSELQSRENLVC